VESVDPPVPELTEYGGLESLAGLAAKNSFALRDTAPWLHRRVERITTTDRTLVRRHVSVDFSIPQRLKPFRADGQGTRNVYFVPVALLRKWPPLMDFDLRSEDGSSLPLLTSRTNREVDVAALTALAPEGDERKCLTTLLHDVATSDSIEAARAVDAIGEFLRSRQEKMSTEHRVAWARTLRVAGSLVSSSILWARVEGYPGSRHVIKFAYTDPAPRELRLERRLFAAFSLMPRRALFELPNLGERGSYHLEIEAPRDLAIYNAQLVLRDFPPEPQSPRPSRWIRSLPTVAAGRLSLAVRQKASELFGTVKGDSQDEHARFLQEPKSGKAYTWNTRERSYFYIVDSQDQYGVATVDLGIGDRSLLTSAWRASIVMTLLLAFLWQARSEVASHADFAVALLAIFPPLLMVIVVRSGEHPMMRQLMSGVRTLVITNALLPVLDAVILIGRKVPTAGNVQLPFLITFIVGAAITAVLTASWLLPPRQTDELEPTA
jgi:hypothetical protein